MMKKAIKKLMAAALAIAMLCVMAVPAFAAGAGSITIDNAVLGETYTAYKMFDVVTSKPGTDAEGNATTTYTYTVADGWKDFFETGAGKDYISLNEKGQPTWKDAKNSTSGSADLEAFAEAALAYAAANGISGHSEKATGTIESASATISGLDLGYYVVNTSVGALCSLDTVGGANTTIKEKNDKPDIDKDILEDDAAVKENTAKIGDTVAYEVTVTVQKGATGYEVRDTMTTGLTFNDDITVTVNGTAVDAANYTVAKTEGYTFTLAFDDDYILGLAAGTQIKVHYTATINDQAVIDGSGNINNVKLKYGDQAETVEHPVTTKVYEFDLVKVDGANNQLLPGAQFKLYDAAEGGSEIKLVKDGDGYRVATAAEIADGKAVDHMETTAEKAVRIKGLAGTTYWLEETKEPAGYNKLTARVEVDLTKGSKTTTMTTTTWDDNGGIKIENNAGATLPSTGGIGTTIFYVVGGGLMVAAIILLVTKKRMENK